MATNPQGRGRSAEGSAALKRVTRKRPKAKPPPGVRGPVKARPRFGEKKGRPTSGMPTTVSDTPRAQRQIATQRRTARAAADRRPSFADLVRFIQRHAPDAARATGAVVGQKVATQMGLATTPEASKFARKVGSDLGEQALYTPLGLVVAEEAIRKDISDATRGDYSGKRSRQLGKAIVKDTAETLRHPLRRPGYTLTTVGGAVGGGANVVARVGAGGRTLAAGGGLRAAAKAKPVPGEIPIKVAGRTVGHILEPDAAIPRAITRRKARRVNKMLEDPARKPIPGPGGKLYEATVAPEHTAGRAMRAERSVKADLAAAPATTLRRASSELTPAEHAALRIYAIEGNHALRHPDEAVGRHAQAHSQWADEGIEPELNKTIAADTAKAAAVLRNPRAHPNFVRAAALSRRASRKSGKEHQRRGHLTEEAERQSRATLAEVYGRGRVGMGTVTREKTRVEIETRLAKLDQRYNALVQKVADQFFEMDPKVKGHETRGRNRARNRLYRGKRLGNISTVNQDIRKAAENRIAEVVERNPDLPESRLLMERDELRARLDALTEHEFGPLPGETAGPRPSLGTVKKRERIHEPGIGINRPPEGSFYFPTGEWFKPGGKVTPGKPSQPRPGPYGMGPPSQSLRGTGKQRTGEGVKRGVIEDVPGAIAENIVTRQRRYSAEDLYRLARSVGTPTKVSENQIGIRSTRSIRSEHRQLVRAEQAALHSGDETALVRATQARRDFEAGRAEPIVEGQMGAKIPGVRWVDKRLLKESEAPKTDHVLMDAARAVNRPARDFQVYFRPGYVATNLPSNVIMGGYLHGRKVVTEMRRAQKMKKGDPLTDWAEQGMGISRTESYGMGSMEGTGKLARAERKAVGVITDITDRDFRLAMLRVRAAERGYKGDAGLRRLMNGKDAKTRADAVAIFRRGRKDAVDFNSLAPKEKQLAEAVYFYPWISRGAFAWTGRAAVNRPVTTAVLGQLAAQGKEAQPEWLKEGPRWLRGQVATHLGLSDPKPLWTPASPVQSVESLLHPRESYAAELGTPVLQAAGSDPERIGGELVGSTALGRILRASGVVTDPRIVGKPPKTFPETPRSTVGRALFGGPFPQRPDREALRDQALRDMPPEQRIRERAKEYPPAERADYIRREMRERERKDWPAEKRAYVKVFDERQEFYEAAKEHAPDALENGKLPSRLRQAFNLEAERQREYAKASEGIRSGTPEYQRARLAADLNFLRKHDLLDDETVDSVLRAAADADLDLIEGTRRDISERYYQGKGGQLYYISHARRALKEAGASLR